MTHPHSSTQTPSTVPAQVTHNQADEPFIFLAQGKPAHYPYSLGEYARRFLWEWAWRLLFRLSFRRAHGWRRFLLRLFGASVHPTAGISPSAQVVHPWLLTLEAHAILHDRVRVYNLGPVRVGRYSVVSQDVYLCAGTHDYTDPSLPLLREPIVIGHGVWVCAGAFIGPGVTVGDNSIVGARSVVVKDVPAQVIVGGNPARVIKERPMNKQPD